MDLSLPSPAYLAGSLIFGIIGFAAYRYGKCRGQNQTRWLGVGLMVYPYAISQTWLLYLLGIALCACLYFFRD
jgi:hypothetical protein